MPYIGKKPADIIATAVDTTTGTFSGEVDAASLDISGNIDVDGTTNLDVVDIDGAVDMASTLAVTGIATFTDDIIIGDGKTIGSASDVDAMTIASNGQVTFTQTLIGTDLDISGSIDIDGTTNLDAVDIDGAVQMGASDDDVRMTLQGNNQYRLALKNAANALVYLGSGGANNFRVSNQAGGTLLELTSASNILLPTASAGIYLGVTSEATSNLLDDYEEGTWTATQEGSTTNPSTPVTVVGTYTKIGNMCYAQFQQSNVDTTGAAGGVRVTGLPFTSSGAQATGNIMTYVRYTLNAGSTNISPYVSGTTISFYQSTSVGGWSEIVHSAGTGAYLSVSVFYKTT